MDKLKVFLAVLKKQHFWVLSGLVLILGLTGWALASSKLADEYKTSRSKIEASYKDLDQLRGQERENADWIRELQAETARLKAIVKTAWEDVYSEQREKVLRWPMVLGEDFLRIVPQLAPNEEIPVDQRERYWNYAREEFPRLLEIIDARSYREKVVVEENVGPRGRPGAKFGPGGAARPGADPDEKPAHDYKVIWDKGNQEAIDRRLEWSNTPTSQEVRDTQEDLWVYQALLTIIRHLNDRADGHHNAKVKDIRSLLIGHDAALEFQEGMAEGRIAHPEVGTVQPGQPGQPPGMPGGRKLPTGAAAAGPTGPTPGGIPGQQAKDDGGRYVDEKGMSLAATAAAPAEFKRMPVHMQLLMDQREISRLLVECANSPLPVEVRQLRIRPGDTVTNPVGGGRPAPGRGGALRLGPGGRGRPMANPDDDREKNPYDVVVEVQGIIYIFNPPDQAKLAPAITGEPAPADASSAEPGSAPATDDSGDAATETPPGEDGATPKPEVQDADADASAPAGEKAESGNRQPDEEANDSKPADSNPAGSNPAGSPPADGDDTDKE